MRKLFESILHQSGKLVLCVTLLLAGAVTPAVMAQSCQLDNAALQAMPIGQIQIKRSDGTQLQMDARIADNNETRAAGFQQICASTIAKMPILFIFPRPLRPSFHMRNVVAPIDIAFIREDGTLDAIQAMHPYVLMSVDKPLYSPRGPVIAALESQSQFYADNEIDEAARISWTLPAE